MHPPLATYRLQFTPAFGFSAAQKILDYLRDLGISDIYAAPIFSARTGSLHGYDGIDYNCINPELGGEAGFTALRKAMEEMDMGWLQDIVPNHMAFSSENRMLMDVLEKGPKSAFHEFFDIDWDHPDPNLNGKVLTPFLGSFYGEALKNSELRLAFDEAGFSIRYYDWRFPVSPETYDELLSAGSPDNASDAPMDEILRMANDLKFLFDIESAQGYGRRFEELKEQLWEVYDNNAAAKKVLDEILEIFNSDLLRLDRLLSEQHYRLAYWRTANQEIDYRRFFQINDLICVRAEEKEVFEATHQMLLDLVKKGMITGIRIDHLDGMADPKAYLKRLRRHAPAAYIIAEKILGAKEELREDWPIQGTTGYEFMNAVCSLFCQTKNEAAFDRIYSDFIGHDPEPEKLALSHRMWVLTEHLAGDVENLTRRLKHTANRYIQGRDLTRSSLNAAIIALMVSFPVYRTYLDRGAVADSDRKIIQGAAEKALADHPKLRAELEAITGILLGEWSDAGRTEEDQDAQKEIAVRFQQLTAPLAAKGFEDTTLYVYNRLIALNKVGGEPFDFGWNAKAFHEFNRKRAGKWPHTLNSTATHDTKRGADAGVRICVLSEIPEEWAKQVNHWREINKDQKKKIDGQDAPDSNEEYFLYQALVGVYPFEDAEQDELVQRLSEYMVKALREAEIHTDWIDPHSEYEKACTEFVEKILDQQSRGNPFLNSFLPFQEKIARYGVINSLAQVILKVTSPGVPDQYQGAELWDLSLVDPDNRREVDYGQRKDFLAEIQKGIEADLPGLIRRLIASPQDGKIKLFTLHRALCARKNNGDIFAKGDYRPLEIKGEKQDHLIAFARTYENRWSLTAVPILPTGLYGDGKDFLKEAAWGDTAIELPQDAPKEWENAITQETLKGKESLKASDIFTLYPGGAVLIGSGKS